MSLCGDGASDVRLPLASVFVWSSAPNRRLRRENSRIAWCSSFTPKSGHSTSLTNSSA